MQRCSASMRRPPFRLWIGSIPCCRSPPVELNATDSSTTCTERFPSTLPWKPLQAACTARPRPAIPAGLRRISRRSCGPLPIRQQIHIILDNLSAHKTRLVDQFLCNNPRVQFHFTPTYSSWLNQVELWFGKIKRDLIARGVFTSVPDLARKIKRYIRAYSANAKPIQWKYSDPKRRISSNELTATVH
jgi:transposase